MITSQDRIRYIADRLRVERLQLAVAESLTGGLLSATIAKGPDASSWFSGAIVAYQRTIKYKLLKVAEGPVVSEHCALQMAHGVADLMGANLGLAVTGVGGPEPEEGQPPGTVWACAHAPDQRLTELAYFANRSPAEVCSASCSLVLDLAITLLS